MLFPSLSTFPAYCLEMSFFRDAVIVHLHRPINQPSVGDRDLRDSRAAHLRRSMLLIVLRLLLGLLLLLLLLRTHHRIAQFCERLYRRLVRRLLEHRRRGRDYHGPASRWNTKGNGHYTSRGSRCFQNVRPRFQLGRRCTFRTLRVILEGDVMVWMLRLGYLAFAGGLEGNVTLWWKTITRKG